MTRIVSSAFQGVLPRDAMRGALVHGQRWLRAAIGDTALVADRILGLNGATAIDHSGSPNGCSLAMPLWCQAMPAKSTQPASASGIYYIVAIPIYVAPGEDLRGWFVELDLSRPFGNPSESVEIRDTSWTIEQNVPLSRITQNEGVAGVIYRAEIEALSAGWHYLCVVRNLSADDEDSAIYGGRMIPIIGSSRAVGIPSPDSSAVGSPFTAHASFSPTSVIDFHEGEIFAVKSAIAGENGVNGWALTRLVKMQNSLWEWITGARIPGNAARQVTPIRSHNQSVMTGEAAMLMPVVAIAVGAADPYGTGSKATSTSIPGWHRVLTHETTPINVSRADVRMPDFDDSATAMTCKVLAFDEGADPTQWRFRVTSTAGTSSWVALSALGGDAYGATITSVPYNAGADNTFTLQAENIGNSGAATPDDIAVTGWTIAHT